MVQGSDIRLFTIVFLCLGDGRWWITGLPESCCLSYVARLKSCLFWCVTTKKKATSIRRLGALVCLLADWLVVCECNRLMIFLVGPLEDSFPVLLWSGPSFVDGEPRVLSDVCLIRRFYGGQAGRYCYDVLPHHPQNEGRKEGKKTTRSKVSQRRKF